jgi:hypothetical protein
VLHQCGIVMRVFCIDFTFKHGTIVAPFPQLMWGVVLTACTALYYFHTNLATSRIDRLSMCWSVAAFTIKNYRACAGNSKSASNWCLALRSYYHARIGSLLAMYELNCPFRFQGTLGSITIGLPSSSTSKAELLATAWKYTWQISASVPAQRGVTVVR